MKSSDALLRVARLFKIITLVRSHASALPLGRATLAEACQCTERTITRDLDLLAEAHIPITFDRARRAYTLPEKSKWVFPIAELTPEDALALALMRAVTAKGGMPQHGAVLSTLDKLTGFLPPALRLLFTEAAEGLDGGRLVRDYSDVPMDVLRLAAQARETVEIEYQSLQSGERAWRRVDPYQVAARDGQFWELHGWCHRRQEVRTFALDGVMGVRGTGEAFTLREQEWAAFTSALGIVGGLRGGAQVVVRVTFDPHVAPYALRRTWPDGLAAERQQDGTALLTGTAQGTAGLLVELLRWRRHAHVEGGPELLAAMRAEVQAMSALYE